MSPAEKKKYKISRSFSRTPGPRKKEEGDWSGEELRQNYLLPEIQRAETEGYRLVIDLDGTAGYGTSFLEEVFGGLIRINGYSKSRIMQILEIVSNEEPYLLDDIDEYMKQAEKNDTE